MDYHWLTILSTRRRGGPNSEGERMECALQRSEGRGGVDRSFPQCGINLSSKKREALGLLKEKKKRA